MKQDFWSHTAHSLHPLQCLGLSPTSNKACRSGILTLLHFTALLAKESKWVEGKRALQWKKGSSIKINPLHTRKNLLEQGKGFGPPTLGRENLWSGLAHPEEPSPATFLIGLDCLTPKDNRAHAAALIQLIKLERATRHQSRVNWALGVSELTGLLLFMANKPQHGWQSFKAVHKPPPSQSLQCGDHWERGWAGARAPAAPCALTPNEQQSFLQGLCRLHQDRT